MIEKLAGKATEMGPAYNEDIGNNLEEGRGIILAVGRHCIKDQSASLWQGMGWQSQVAAPSFLPPSLFLLSLYTFVSGSARDTGAQPGRVRVSLCNGMLLHSSPMGHLCLACGSIFHSTQISSLDFSPLPSCHMARSKGSQASVT